MGQHTLTYQEFDFQVVDQEIVCTRCATADAEWDVRFRCAHAHQIRRMLCEECRLAIAEKVAMGRCACHKCAGLPSGVVAYNPAPGGHMCQHTVISLERLRS